MRHGAKTAAVTAVAVVMLAAGGYGAYSLVGSSSKGSAAPKPRTVVAEPPSAALAASTASTFLADWSKGDLAGASQLTDDPQSALTALTAFQSNVKPSALTLAAGGPATAAAFASATASPSAASSAAPSPSAAGSPAASASGSPGTANQVLESFSAKAEFTGTANVWQYTGYLGMEKMSDGTAVVHWAPTVIHPQLTAGETLTTQPIYSPPSSVTDRNGKSLAGFPSLTGMVAKFQQSVPTGDPADAGSAVELTDPTGKNQPQKLFTITPPKPGQPFKLTIDATLQAAAENAVKEQAAKGHQAGMVAIEPSTGQILAVADAGTAGNTISLLGATAPGSTMKVITATALLQAGISPSANMPCPSTFTVGQTYKNDFSDARPNNTFTNDFAVSCNTAFIKQATQTLKSGDLAATAKNYFGIGDWKIGVTSADGSVPGPGQSPDETAAEYIGQGKVTMNPLQMASVAATVESGTFKQPILVAGLPQTPAAQQIPQGVLTNLRSMMNAVFTESDGTGYGLANGLTGNIGGKTGTAEVGSASNATNSWFTGYRDNLAVSAEVIGGGFGAQAALPAVTEVLRVGNPG
ncbi:penicillin-binding transpeptidase domain-containing protein [Kitasatospora sp. NPDC052896]|uniref:penicillin-binding transpeptidase domain-containing protein n=1 Tax=Kitasatospora sp. NPDC052896 TaxID=3364061 RepID=UPI0037CBA635